MLNGLISNKETDEVVNNLEFLVNRTEKIVEDIPIEYNIILKLETTEQKKKLFKEIFYELLDEVEWSHIITSFMLMKHILEKSNKDFEKYFQWTIEVIESRISPWVDSNGGWSMMNELARKAKELDANYQKLRSLLKLMTGLTITLVCIKLYQKL